VSQGGANRGANASRRRAISGYRQPPSTQLNAIEGDTGRLPEPPPQFSVGGYRELALLAGGLFPGGAVGHGGGEVGLASLEGSCKV